MVGWLIVAGVWTGVGFSKLKKCQTRIRIRIQNFLNRSGVGVWKVTPATSAMDTGRVRAIRKSADMFGKRFIRLCLWRKCKISTESLRRNHRQSSSVCVNILATNVYQGCSGVGTRYHTFGTNNVTWRFRLHQNMAAISQMCYRQADSRC